MFPTDLRQIALAGVATLFFFLFRIPAVVLSTKGLAPGKKEFWLLNVAMRRGLAAGVLSIVNMVAPVTDRAPASIAE